MEIINNSINCKNPIRISDFWVVYFDSEQTCEVVNQHKNLLPKIIVKATFLELISMMGYKHVALMFKSSIKADSEYRLIKTLSPNIHAAALELPTIISYEIPNYTDWEINFAIFEYPTYIKSCDIALFARSQAGSWKKFYVMEEKIPMKFIYDALRFIDRRKKLISY